jgi:hypothetical protein
MRVEDKRMLQQALGIAEQQLAVAERELHAARGRVSRLRDAVFSIRSLLTEQESGADQGELFQGEGEHVSQPHRMRVGDTQGERHITGQELSTTDKAVAILADAGQPLPMSAIRAEWKRRGWVDARWKTPDSAITMAVHRAKKAGKVDRMLDGTWVLPKRTQDELWAERRGRDEAQGD